MFITECSNTHDILISYIIKLIYFLLPAKKTHPIDQVFKQKDAERTP